MSNLLACFEMRELKLACPPVPTNNKRYLTRLSRAISISPLKDRMSRRLAAVSENAHKAIRAFNNAHGFKERSNAFFIEEV